MHCMSFVACAETFMLGTKLLTPTSACMIHWLAPGTSALRPTAPMRFGVWSSANGSQPGAALVGNESLPAVTMSPVGLSPGDTLGVQSVAVCSVLAGSDVAGGAVVVVALVDLLLLPPANTRITTSAMTPTSAMPARINHGSFERFGGGPGG